MLGNEGGYSDDADDPGGATNHGISLNFLKDLYNRGYVKADVNKDGIIDPKDIQQLNTTLVKEMYRMEFWSKVESIPNDLVAIKVFDAGVNIGIRKAIIFLQQCLGATADGIIGPQTIKAIESANTNILLQQFIEKLCTHYRNLAYKNPKLDKYLKGWIARAKRTPSKQTDEVYHVSRAKNAHTA